MAWGGGKIVVTEGGSVFWGPDTASLAGLTQSGPSLYIPLFSRYLANSKVSITGIAWGGPPGQERFVVTCYGGIAYSEVFSE
jgi:hypothetical protein